MSAPTAAVASAAVKTVTAQAPARGMLHRFCVAPVMNTLCKIEKRSAKKVAGVEPAATTWIRQHEATGVDAASVATDQFVLLQGQLMHYRVTRLFAECRHIASGAYCKDYGLGKLLQDARFLTQLFFVFLVSVMVGRRSVFSPIDPDSPFAIALDNKVNPNY